jgi:hypothetical protein
MRNIWQNINLKWFSLQSFSPAELDELIIENLEKFVQVQEKAKRFIPAENWVEIRFETLENDAGGTLEKIYSTLGISGMEEQKEYFQEFLEKEKGYRKFDYGSKPVIPDEIMQRLSKISGLWGYRAD